MYLFLTVLASQIALHSWLHVNTYKKRQFLKLEKHIKQQQTPMQNEVFKHIECHLAPLIKTETRNQSYIIDTKYGNIYPQQPSDTKTALLEPIFWDKIFDPGFKGDSSSTFVRLLRPSLFRYVYEAPHNINRSYYTRERDLALSRKGPNKHNIIVWITEHDFSILECLYASCISKYFITLKDRINQWFEKPCVQDAAPKRSLVDCALAPNSNRYALMYYTDTGILQLAVYDLIKKNKKYKSQEVACTTLDIPQKNLPKPFYNEFRDLTFVGGTALFCIHYDDIYQFSLKDAPTGTIISYEKVYAYKEGKSAHAVSFAASKKFPIGFMLRYIDFTDDDPDAYADICTINLQTKKYKRIGMVKTEECPICKAKFLNPYNITYDDTMIGINFTHVTGLCRKSHGSFLYPMSFAYLKTMHTRIEKVQSPIAQAFFKIHSMGT